MFCIVIVLTATLFTSCKKCDPSNQTSGLIIKDAIVRTIGNQAGQRFISTENQLTEPIEMSLDGGVTYAPVDFDNYSVFALTTTSSCSSGYSRSVNSDDLNGTVTYSIAITECNTCENNTTIDNWVLTSKVPNNYTPFFSIQ
jgi:hypothetical protein